MSLALLVTNILTSISFGSCLLIMFCIPKCFSLLSLCLCVMTTFENVGTFRILLSVAQGHPSWDIQFCTGRATGSFGT